MADTLNEKRILITGGAGFIGSHLVETYLADGWDVCVLDNLESGKKSNIPVDKVDFHEADIRDHAAVDAIFTRFKPSHVSHHAAQVSVRKSLLYPAHDAEINILGTLNLLDLATKHNVKQFIFASSGGAIYGESENKMPQKESDETKPLSPYGLAKLGAERYCNFYAKEHSLPLTIFRYANVYGPRQTPEGEAGVIPLFLDCFSQKRPAKIYGSGEQVRDFVSVSDVVVTHKLATDQGKVGIYNIGSGATTSVNELYNLLASLWSEISKEQATQTKKPAISGEVVCSMPAIDKAKSELTWQPCVLLRDGLSQTVSWFLESRDEKQKND